jgi:FAD/FMN-containing dehydrogenase
MAATDQGGIVRRHPCAVLKPGSARDIARIVRYANERELAVAMRGRGHARYGQALVQDGIVIDSRSLDAVLGVSGDTIDVRAGASLAATVGAALAAGFALPVTTHCSMLSVGGFLSAGGEARGSHQFGAFIDQVAEIEVVTGDGRLLTCSEAHEGELFEMVLGGMGQCGIIVRARLRLVPAPAQVFLRTLAYHSLEPFLRDQERLATEAVDGRFDVVKASMARAPSGRWIHRITVGAYAAAAANADPAPRLRNLSGNRMSGPSRLTYAAYQGVGRSPESSPSGPGTPPGARPTAPPASALRRTGDPSLAVWLPASGAREFLTGLLESPANSAGIVSIDFSTYDTRRFRRPLLRVPEDQRMVAIWLSRIALAKSGPTLEEQLEANARLLRHAIAMGGKRYPPYGGIATPSDWRQHYGEETYARFAAAKGRYDPRRVLTPGPGIFP